MEKKSSVAALFDVSNSITQQGRAAFGALFSKFRSALPDTNFHLYTFASKISEPATLDGETFSQEETVRLLEDGRLKLDGSQTALEEGLRNVASTTQASSILLFSDGFETSGRSATFASELATRGIRVYPVIPDIKLFQSEALSISSLHAPLLVNSGDLAEVRTVVRNSKDTPQSALLELWFENKKLYGNSITVPPFQEKLFTVKTPPLEGGLHRLRAVLKPDSTSEASHERFRWLSVKSRSKILLLNGSTADQRLLRPLLNNQGYALESIVADGSSQIPTNLDNYSLVVVNNIAKKQLPSAFLPRLKERTEKGTGVILVGGERSFGLGEYIDTPLEEISPLKFLPPKTTKKRLNSAVVILIDKSKSMRQNNKIGAARKASVIAIDALKDEDFIGVIGFDDAPFELLPLRTVKENRQIASSRIQHLSADGGTRLKSSLQLCRRKLQAVEASRKHIILLSDGAAIDASEGYEAEMAAIRQEGITLTAIALGVDADAVMLKGLAQKGKGAFVHTFDPTQLPEIFIQDIKVSTGEKTLKERDEFSITEGASGVKSVDITQYPSIKGFVETLPKKGIALELVTQVEEKLHPILASWKYGAGSVVAFTSDANGRWTDPWVDKPIFQRFWTQIVEAAKNRTTDKAGQLDFDVRQIVDRGAVQLELAIYDEQLGTAATPSTTVEVIEPGGEKKKIAFSSLKKGLFGATISNARAGDYKLAISYGSTKLAPLALTISQDALGEKPGNGVNLQLLSHLAQVTKGALNPDPKEINLQPREEKHYEYLFPPLVVLALLLIIMEALIREGRLSLFKIPKILGRQKKNFKHHAGIYGQRRTIRRG